jgi:tetratricopeptide (TPR) repeat protein
MHNNFNKKKLKTKKLTEIILFLSVFIIYCFSVSKTINFWDSSEFITSSYTLQASHPPGSPLYTIICGFVLSFFSSENAAIVSNIISSFFGATTVLLVYKITYKITVTTLKDQLSKTLKQLPLFTGLLASLTLAFSTSFWTASTETEVYTLSFTLMTLMIYTILKWYYTKDIKRERRLLLLFFFLLGLSVSVHLILLSIVIPFSLLFVFRKFKTSIKNFFIGLMSGIILFFVLYVFVIKGILKLASVVDIYFVNTLQLPANFGALLTIVLVFLSLIFSSIFLKNKQKSNLNLGSLSILLFLIGSSVYILPLLRSNVNTLVAEKVNTAKRLKTYISAERFGVDNIPLLYGPTYNAQLDNARPFLNTKPVLTYDAEAKKYVEAHDGISKKINYSFKFKTVFPRMYDTKNAANYAAWTNIKGEAIAHKVDGKIRTFMKPTFSENFSFFTNYQLDWLNLRYLFWNFVGKQNDHHGLGYIKDGNWVSGFNFIDKYRVGEESSIPAHYKQNKGNDKYYFLPFILGLLGVIALIKKKEIFVFLLLLFLTFGVGITIFVNPLPSSILIRERDYILIGSFIIFSIWIGLSLIPIINLIKKFTNKKIVLLVIVILTFLASPIQLFAKGWDNHQNGNDKFAYNFGKAYLDSCPKQAILITNGDNMTFPLWYLQEVEGYRTDVRVINFDQLNIDTHINNLKLTKKQSLPVTFDLDKELYIAGIEPLIPLQNETEDPIELEVLTQFLNSDKTLTNWNGRKRHYIPGDTFSFSIDTTNTYFYSYLSRTYDTELVSKLVWTYPKGFYSLSDIVVLNIIKNNLGKRPICFTNNSKTSHLVGLNSYLFQKGLISELTPLKRKSKKNNPKLLDTELSFQLLVENSHFKNFDSKHSYVKDENRTYARDILRQNYYFLAQALLEENTIEKAKKTVDKCLELFPNNEVPYKQYAYALGRLYFRMGLNDLGDKVCKTAMDNIWNEILWITSFNTPNPIINVRHANKLLSSFKQMTTQIKPFNKEYAQQCEENLKNHVNTYNVWYLNNWPY